MGELTSVAMLVVVLGVLVGPRPARALPGTRRRYTMMPIRPACRMASSRPLTQSFR